LAKLAKVATDDVLVELFRLLGRVKTFTVEVCCNFRERQSLPM